MTAVDLSDFRAFDKQLRQLVQRDQVRVLRAGATQVGAEFNSITNGAYPPEVRKRAVAKYWTAKQKRWWWYTMRAKALGKSKALPGWKAAYKTIKGRKTLVLSGQYTRSNTMIKTMTYVIEDIPGGVQTVYGPNVKYAKYVIGPDADQSKYHKGNWEQLPALAEQHMSALQKVFETAVIREINRILSEE